jgi:hypothetical protein
LAKIGLFIERKNQKDGFDFVATYLDLEKLRGIVNQQLKV